MSQPRPRALVGALAALLFVACTAQPMPDPSTPPPVAADAESDVNAQPRDRLRDGGLLRFPLAELPTQWNPRHPDAEAGTQRVLAALNPTHLTLDAAGRATPNPDFVADLAVEHGDRTVVTLDLVERAVWGDATPITAADWVATWRAASGQVPDLRFASSDGWERVAEVREGANPRQVVVTFHDVDPDWAQPLVAGPLPAATLATADAFTWGAFEDGRHTGPFLVTHVDTVQGLVTLERNPLWWGDRPKLDTIMFRTVPEEALAAAFQHNELDAWDTGPSADRVEQAQVAADAAVREAPGVTGRVLKVSRSGALADLQVRRAVLMALDRAKVGVHDLPDGVEAPRAWSDPLVLPTQPGYVDQARATGLSSDTARAGQLLDEAGWELRAGRRMKEGQLLTLSVLVPAGDERAAEELEDLGNQLDAVGVGVKPVTADADLTPASVRVGAFPWAQLPDAVATTVGAPELAEEVSDEADPVRRADQASQLARLLWQDVVTIPLYQEPEFVAVRQGLANLGAHGFATTDWEDVGWTS